MKTAPEPKKKPGLASIHEGREQRARGRYSRATPNLLLICVVSIGIILFGYRYFSGKKLEDDKDALLSKQRAVEKTVGAEWVPLRDQIEKITVESADHFDADFVDADASKWDFRSLPGLYLRLRVGDAKNVASVRKNAQDSLKDSFVGCLLRETNAAAARGEADSGVFAEQPWNMRTAYASTRILTEAWVSDVKASDDDLRLRVFVQQYKKAADEEIPLAIQLIKKAQFFLLVLDEDTLEAAAKADGGALSEDVLQLVPHDARVRIVNLRTGKDIIRVRRRGEGSFVSASEHQPTDPEVRDAMQRNVNNCALAQQVQSVLGLEARK